MTRHTLVDLIAWLADNKYMLGRRFSEWTNRAPALEAAVAAAAMAQDELGHARSLYAALRNLPDSPEAYLNEEKRERRLHMPVLNQPFEYWADFVAANALFDRALTLVFEAARESTPEPLRQRSVKILQEERFHRQYGAGWLKKMANDKATHGSMQTAVDRLWAATSEWLGSGYNGEVVANKILAQSAAELQARWTIEGKALLTKCGLTVNEH